MRISDWSSDVCSSDLIAAGDAGLQGLGTGRLDRGQAMVEHRPQHLDELAIAVGVALQLGANPGQGRRQVPVLERSAVAQRDRLQIGRASCRERECQYGENSVAAVYIKKKTTTS